MVIQGASGHPVLVTRIPAKYGIPSLGAFRGKRTEEKGIWGRRTSVILREIMQDSGRIGGCEWQNFRQSSNELV